ncbi:MFS transporter [Neobacillus niacini]|uniref:MFS transporter n=1 Tax=Neobacillus niacini TaxID=86668 RepID=UPI0021CAEDBA|nr:MFS transporter [Neobacillus niacini]MCM3765857.1 MFS transporter [Neobacillus niacini]
MVFYHNWAAQFSTYNRNIKLSFIANILAQIGLGVFMVIYNFYIRKLGYSEAVNGQVISMTSLATALILIPAGIISDRYSRKKVILYGVLISGIILLARSVVSGQQLLITLAFISGLAMAFLQVSGIPWLAENSTPEQRVNLFSLHFAFMTAANVVGSLLGGLLTDVFSYFVTDVNSIRLTLIIGAIIYTVAIIPTMKFQNPVRKSTEPKKSAKSFSWKNNGMKLIVLFAVAQILIGFGSGLVIPYLNLYFSDRFSASTTSIGFIISLGQAATAFAMFIGPWVVKKVGEVKAVVFLQLASLPFLLLTAYTNHLWIAALGFLFRQALMNAGNPIQMSLMMSKVNDSMKGLANSVNQMVFNLGWALMGPVSTGIVVQYGAYWGYAYVFTITATLYLIGSLYFFIVFKGISTKAEKSVTTTKIS